MSKYKLRFWFEHGGTCIWGINDEAKEKYGYSINHYSLPLSENLISELNDLIKDYATYLDWDCPLNPSSWTYQHKIDFLYKAKIAYEKLKEELDLEFEIENNIHLCVE